MRVPTVHLNGSSYTTLCEQYRGMLRMLDKAITALHEGTPHDRDYYPQGESAGPSARAEHQSRIDRVQDVYDELACIFQKMRDATSRARPDHDLRGGHDCDHTGHDDAAVCGICSEPLAKK